MRNPPWSRDELILALDLYLNNRQLPPNQYTTATSELSRILKKRGQQFENGHSNFRNNNSVYMKMMNFCSLDEEYTVSGRKGLTRIGKEDRTVWDEYSHNPRELSTLAETIRENILYDNKDRINYAVDIIVEAQEGRILTLQHLKRERNRSLVNKKKSAILSLKNRLECEACGFDFEKKYGERGKGFSEVHHIMPLMTLKPGTRTSIADLALLCANCHRMIHSHRPWLSMSELKELIRGDEL